MPFQYTPYRNQYVGSITDLMGRGRDAEAQALIDSANAQAQAAQVSGQAWGGAVQSIGNTIAAIPGQMQAQQDRDLEREATQADIGLIAARTESMAAEDQRRIAAAAQADEQDIRISAVLANPNRTTEDFVRIMGPQDGITFAAGLHKLEDDSVVPLSPSDRAEHLRGIARSMALLSPELQAEYWPATRARLLADERLRLRPEDIPEQPNQAFLDGIRNYDVEPPTPLTGDALDRAEWQRQVDAGLTTDSYPRWLTEEKTLDKPPTVPARPTEGELNRAEYQREFDSGRTTHSYNRWLTEQKTLPESPDTTPSVPLITDDQGVVDVPASMTDLGLTPAPHEDKLWDRADWTTTGLGSILVRVLGPTTGLGEESMANMTAIDLVREMATRSLAENPRLAVTERTAIREGIDIDTGWLESPDKVRVKFRELETVLRRALERKDLIDDIGVILQTIDILGVPAVQTPPKTYQFDTDGNLIP